MDKIRPEVMRALGFQDVMVDTPLKWHGDFKNNNVGPGGQDSGVGKKYPGDKIHLLKNHIAYGDMLSVTLN